MGQQESNRRQEIGHGTDRRPLALRRPPRRRHRLRIGHRRARRPAAHRTRRRGRRARPEAPRACSSRSSTRSTCPIRRRSTGRSRRSAAGSTALFNIAGVSSGIGDPLRVVTINFLGTRHFTEALISAMPPGSSIATVSSLAGVGVPRRTPRSPWGCWTPRRWPRESNGVERNPEPVADGGGYRLSKEAIILYGMANVAALGAKGIRINCTGPGVTDTPILDQLRTAFGQEFLDSFQTPLGRVAGPDEQARVLAFLNSGAASYITGQVIWVDGGSVGGAGLRRRVGRERKGRNMASLSDFRRVADDVRNWGRWGDADELGTLNLITAEKVRRGGQSGQARQGVSARRGLRLVGTAGRVPLPAEPDARDDDRRRRRQHIAGVRPQVAAEPRRQSSSPATPRAARCASTTT